MRDVAFRRGYSGECSSLSLLLNPRAKDWAWGLPPRMELSSRAAGISYWKANRESGPHVRCSFRRLATDRNRRRQSPDWVRRGGTRRFWWWRMIPRFACLLRKSLPAPDTTCWLPEPATKLSSLRTNTKESFTYYSPTWFSPAWEEKRSPGVLRWSGRRQRYCSCLATPATPPTSVKTLSRAWSSCRNRSRRTHCAKRLAVCSRLHRRFAGFWWSTTTGLCATC